MSERIPVYPLVRKFGYVVEGLFYLLVLFGPWALGTTEEWSSYTLCIGCGVFFLAAIFLKILDKAFTPRGYEEELRLRRKQWNWSDWIFISLGALCVIYVTIQYFNAQSMCLDLEYSEFQEYSHLEWLPSSLDKPYTLYYLLRYVALYLTYIGARILFQTGQAYEIDPVDGMEFTPRMERFLWVALGSAFILVIVGSLMRLDNEGKLLWVVERSVKAYETAGECFGPYPYRTNASQYLNMLWPVGIGLWWATCSWYSKYSCRHKRRGSRGAGIYVNKYFALAVLGFFVLTGVWAATSRGGVWISGGVAILLVTFIGLSVFCRGRGSRAGDETENHPNHASSWIPKIILVLAIAALAVAANFGLDINGKDSRLVRRLSNTEETARIQQYMASLPIHKDYPVYGIGAGAYGSLYWMYLEDKDKFFAITHSDWLGSLIELGFAGLGLVLLTLVWGLLIPWFNRRGTRFLRLVLLLSFSTVILHAAVDVAFYIFSIFWLFVVLMAFYHSLRRVPRVRRIDEC